MIWPENSTDIDPLRNPDAAAQIDRAAAAIGVPILVGAVLRNPDGPTTATPRWSGMAGQGSSSATTSAGCSRSASTCRGGTFFRLFSGYADRAGYFVPGPGPGAVDMAGVRVGVAICWEVAFDDLVADSVAAGAQVLAVPSNNATFGLSEMTYQQLAMSRVRAVEHDRAGDRRDHERGERDHRPRRLGPRQHGGQFTPSVLVDRTALRDTTTLASRLRSRRPSGCWSRWA